MPVVTRSQSIKAATKAISEKPIAENPVADYQKQQSVFIARMTRGIENIQSATTQRDKMLAANVLYFYISENIPGLFAQSPESWIKFMVSIYFKLTEFDALRYSGKLACCSPQFVDRAFGTFEKVKRFCAPHIMDPKFDRVFSSYTGTNHLLGFERLVQVREHIKKTMKTHTMTLRKMNPVDYSEMC